MSEHSFSVRAREHVRGRSDPEQLIHDLKRVRKALGLTQGEVAQIMGVAENAVHAWETGRFYPGHVYTRGAVVAFLDAAEQELTA